MTMTTARIALVAATAMLVAGCADTMTNTSAGTAPATSSAADAPIVGGAPMFANRTIVENASEASNLTTLVAAVQAAGLVDTLSGPGPFTVFAPTNAAFDALPAGTVDTLLLPENKADLTQILTYHVVSGTVTSADLAQMIADDGGFHVIPTVAGNVLTARAAPGGGIMISDENGGVANVIIADVAQSNGVVHAIDAVLLPAN